jgi:tetratricopeptide (TPR) repeat protein
MIRHNLILGLVLILILSACRQNTDPAKPIKTPGKVNRIEWIDKKLTTIPASLYQCQNLKELNLNFNNIEYLPVEISRLQNLTSINLNNNKLSTLPATIGSISKLQYLSLIYNRLQFLPDEIIHLRNLKILHLEGNPIPEAEISRIDSMLPNTKIYYSFYEHYDPVNYYFNHANELMQKGFLQYAEKYAEKAVKVRPDISQTYLLRAICRYNLQNKTGACEDVRKAAQMNNKEAYQYIITFCN